MKLGAGRNLGLGIATLAVSLGFAAAAEAAKLPKFAVTDVSSPPSTAEEGDTFTALGVVQNKGKKGGKATIRISLRSDNVAENGPIPLGMTETDKVKKGQSEEFSVLSEIPEYTEAGTYYMVACATPAKGSGCLVADGQITISDPPDPPDFQPGARSAGDDLYPQTGNGGYDAENYDLELIYDPVANVFEEGTRTTMTATATQDLSEFTMDFQDIGVTAVTINGQPADSFSHELAEPDVSDDPDVTDLLKLVIDPPGEGIVEGTEMTVVVEYAGEPELITDPDFSWEGWIPACYMEAAVEVCDGGFTVNEPNGAQGWFPSNNFPTDKATFDTAVTVPEGYESAGMGELVDHESNPVEDTETWSWSEDDPTSTYLATATTGQFRYTTPSFTETLTGRLIPQNNFVEATATPAQFTSIDTALGRSEEMHNWLAARFGTYPYDSNGVVADRVPGVCYALENATKSHFAGNCATGDPGVSQSTLLHEIAHQWMGNAVTLKNWDDIWFQEGWAQWVSWSWNFTDGTSTNSPGAQWNTNYQGPTDPKWNTIPTELNDDPVDLFATFPTYTRGAMTYEGYRQIVGTQKFFEFARELQSRFAYDNVSSEQVVDLMIEISDFTGDDLALLEEYFDQWLYEAGRPTVTSDDFS
jgi:aminopeptidase N